MKNILSIVLLIASLTALYSNSIISLEDCRTLAIENNETYQMAKNKIEKATNDKKATFTNYLPKLELTGNYLMRSSATSLTLEGGYLPTFNFNGETGELDPNIAINPDTGTPLIGADGNPIFNQYALFPDKSLEVIPKVGYTTAISLTQPIYTGGKITSAYKMTSLVEEIAISNLKYQKELLLNSTDEAFWKWVSLIEKKRVAQKYLDLLEELHLKVSNSYEVGMSTNNDILKVQVKLNEVKLMFQEVSSGVELTRMNLCQIIGKPLDTPIQPADSLVTLVENNQIVGITEDNFTDRDDYKMLSLKSKISQNNIKFIKSDFLPQIGLNTSYSYIDYEMNDKQESSLSFTAIAQVSIPIFQWGESVFKVKAATLEHKNSKLEMQLASEKMKLQINQALYNIKNKNVKLELTTSSLLQAREYLTTAQDNYEAGMTTLTDILDAQAQWQKAYSANIDAKTEYNNGVNKLLISAGKM